MHKFLVLGVLGFGLSVGAMQAEVVIKIAPPRAVVEHRGPRPSPNHVWVAGYHRWDGNAYAWEAGRWEAPPRAHAVWVAPHYQHRHDGYVFVEGHWR
jgi:hypothetical protein